MPLPEVVGLEQLSKPYTPPPYSEGLDESVIQDAPLDRGKEATLSGTIEETVRPTWGENLLSQIEENFRQTGFGLPVGDLQGPFAYEVAETIQNKLNDFNGKRKISAEEANQLYPGMPTPFQGDIYIEVAQMRYDSVQKRRKLLDWMSRGPELGLGSQIIAGIPTALEPTTLGATIATGGIFKGVSVAKQFGINVAENIAIDIPSHLLQRSRQQETQTVSETLAGSFGGALLGTAISKSIDFAGKRLSHLPPEVRDRAIKEAIVQSEEGKRINSSYLDSSNTELKGGRTEGFTDTNYKYQNFENVPDRLFYSAQRAVDGQNVSSEIGFGKGLFVVDDPSAARNLTGVPTSETAGTVRELSIPPPDKLLDIDKSLDDPSVSSVKTFFEEKFGKELPQDVRTVKQALEYLDQRIISETKPESLRTDLNDKLQKEGVEGYRYTEQRVDGITDNRAFIFDENKAVVRNESEVNNKELPRNPDEVDQNSQKYIEGEDGYKYADPDQDKLISELSAKKVSDVLKDNQEFVKNEQFLEAERLLNDKAKTDPALQEKLDVIGESLKKDKKTVSVIKKMADCILRSVS